MSPHISKGPAVSDLKETDVLNTFSSSIFKCHALSRWAISNHILIIWQLTNRPRQKWDLTFDLLFPQGGSLIISSLLISFPSELIILLTILLCIKQILAVLFLAAGPFLLVLWGYLYTLFDTGCGLSNDFSDNKICSQAYAPYPSFSTVCMHVISD